MTLWSQPQTHCHGFCQRPRPYLANFASMNLKEPANCLRKEKPLHEITLDCSGFNSESIKISTSEDKTKLVVFGQEKTDNLNEADVEKDFSLKEFRRTFQLPANVDVDKLKSRFDDSLLVIGVPFKPNPENAKTNSPYNNCIVFENENGQKCVKFCLNLPEIIDADKVRVICKDQDVIVRAEDKIETSEGGVNQIFYYKRTSFPQNTDFQSLKCTFNEGKLEIVAPLNTNDENVNSNRMEDDNEEDKKANSQNTAA
jgi:HSP20 family molecular chaperone IbpA